MSLQKAFLFSTSVVAACLAMTTAAHAAEASPASSAEVDEVVVTAQKRTERLQNVAISAQVVSEQQRVEANLNSLQDLTESAPSVHIDTSARGNEIYIRGIGSGYNQSFDQSVGMFIDDIYHGRSRNTAATFLDLESVEILKGPQSTFFGNNAIAGAFNIITRKPGDSFDASGRLLYGQFGQYAAEAAVGGPINDVLSMRIAGVAEGQNGWLENVATGEHEPRERNAAGRITLLYHPTDTFDATLKLEGGRNRNQGALQLQLAQCPPQAPFTAAGFCAAALALGDPTGIDTNKIAESPGQSIDLDTVESVLTMNWHVGGHTFTSVTGYYDYDYLEKLDVDSVRVQGISAYIPERFHQFSQELRVASPTGGTFEYLAGVYYQKDVFNYQQDINYNFLTARLASLPPFAPLVPYLPLGQDVRFRQGEESYSAFGSLTWNATDRLKLSAGLRATWVKKDFDWALYFGQATEEYGEIPAPLPAAVAPLANLIGLGGAGAVSLSRKDNAVMPSAKAQYQLQPDIMVYASYSRGFKAGGFNGAYNQPIAANFPFDPEKVNAYEAGVKSELFDRRLRLNLALFRSDYDDLQVAVTIPTVANPLSLVRNVGSSRSQGVELESQWVIGPSFRLQGDVTYLDSKYLAYPNAGVTMAQQKAGLQFQDLSGSPTQFAPQWSGSVTGTWSTELGSNFRFTAALTALFSSSYFLTASDDPLLKQDAYARLDGRLTLESADGRWAFDLIGKNLTNEDIIILGTALPSSLGSVDYIKQAPANVVGQLRFKW